MNADVVLLLIHRNFSMGIESVVEKGKDKSVGGDAGCTACEMAVVWMQNKLKQNQTEEQILNYVNSVSFALTA